uniref:Uncharacterized protein n=1 Tax=Magallana gigas TaxID=29159 RepID=A0A8W8NNC8_MAGGI
MVLDSVYFIFHIICLILWVGSLTPTYAFECKFGFYGIGCLQECSSFCKTSRDCDHVSGVCRHGCRNGWEGDNCFDENVALNKPAWQSHPYIGKPWGAERAVDGHKSNLSELGGQCTISWGVKEAEWLVDLGSVYRIHHIFIQHRTDNLKWSMCF